MDAPVLVAVVAGGFALLGTLIGHYVSRRNTVDEVRIRRGADLAEQISALLQEVHELYDIEVRLYQENFSLAGCPRQAAAEFEKYVHLSQPQRERIDQLMQARDQLRTVIRRSRPFLNRSVLNDIRSYLMIGDFVFQSDGGVMTNNYMANYFENLMNPNNINRRRELYAQVDGQLGKLLN